MGFVYRARDMHFPKANKVVAVKELLSSSSDSMVLSEVIKIFEREANILVTLNHPAIPRIYDFFSERNRIFLVLEYIQGNDLKKILNEYEGFIPVSQVVMWTFGICAVLSYLHNQKPDALIFRDLKPSNIMINHENQVVLIDFGIAKAIQASEKGTIIGTEGYSPPEQYRGVVSPSVDIYALGATLHYLLTRRDPQLEPPFTFHERSIRKINPSVPEDIVQLVEKALAYQPEERFQSIEEFGAALQECVKRNHIEITQGTGSNVNIQGSKSPRTAWVYTTGDEIRSTPAVEGGTLYCGSYDRCLHALSATDGTPLWKYSTQGGLVGQPLTRDGSIYFGSEDNRLYAVSSRTGRLLWTYDTGAPVRSSPRTAEGHLFVGCDSGYLHAINLITSRMTWKAKLGGVIRSSPLVTRDGLFVGTETGEVSYVDFGGRVQWKYFAKKAVTANPAAWKDLILFPSLDGTFYAITQKNGWLQWSFRMGKGSVSSPCIVDNVAVFGSADGFIYAVDLDLEKLIWKYNVESQVSGSPVCHEGLLYVGTSAGKMFCLSLEEGRSLWDFQTGGLITGAPVFNDEMIYFGSADTNLYALSLT